MANRKIPQSEEPQPIWSVWRQDDMGQKYEIARDLTSVSAKKLAKSFEAKGHKQIYWVEKIR